MESVGFTDVVFLSSFSSPQVKTSEFYRYSRQLRQEVDQALSYFHDVNQQPLVETRSNRIRSVRPQTAVFRGMIGHSMVNSKILLLQRPKVSARLSACKALCERFLAPSEDNSRVWWLGFTCSSFVNVSFVADHDL